MYLPQRAGRYIDDNDLPKIMPIPDRRELRREREGRAHR